MPRRMPSLFLFLLYVSTVPQAASQKMSAEIERPSSAHFLCDGCHAAVEITNSKAGPPKHRTEVVVSTVLDDAASICSEKNFAGSGSLVERGEEVQF